MSKRFRDTRIWLKRWFTKLTPVEKCLWDYIHDNCDNAGVWEVNEALAETSIGSKIQWDGILNAFHGNLVWINEEKILSIKFIDFQYGELRENCAPHKNVLKLLQKHNINYPLDYPNDTLTQGYPVRDKDMDKDKDTDKDIKKQLPLWKTNFETYLEMVYEAKRTILKSPDLTHRRILQFHPNLDVEKTLEKSILNFWGTESGWKNKKKSKAAEIDMVETLLKNYDKNKVFKESQNQQHTPNSGDYRRAPVYVDPDA